MAREKKTAIHARIKQAGDAPLEQVTTGMKPKKMPPPHAEVYVAYPTAVGPSAAFRQGLATEQRFNSSNAPYHCQQNE